VLKRCFDVVASALGLILLSPLLLAAAAAVRCSSPGPALFRQERMGRSFRPFQILKLRTMLVDAPRLGGSLTLGDDDSRITRVGRLLRRWKIDELPQLINVLRGEMSLVGPRPEVPKYANLFHDDYAEILAVRPGLTDEASLKYRNEAAQLSAAADPEAEYVSRILPDKIALAKAYRREASFCGDLLILGRTMLAVVRGGSTPPEQAVKRP
jgi:lipopolysaccharide/colanic/teichoic acid biosynthesis glycosyltransferase